MRFPTDSACAYCSKRCFLRGERSLKKRGVSQLVAVWFFIGGLKWRFEFHVIQYSLAASEAQGRFQQRQMGERECVSLCV